MASVDRVAARRIGPRTLGSASIVMSTACLLSISFPDKTFAFVPPVLFPWHYSPGAFLLWIAACVTLSIHRWNLGFAALALRSSLGSFYARFCHERSSLVVQLLPTDDFPF